MKQADQPSIARAWGEPICSATLKSTPEDFVVEEVLPFAADGEGHHWLLLIEKRDINTLDMLDQLAKVLRVSRRSVGYSGLKDRFAVTRQWITLPSQAVKKPDALAACGEHWHVVEAHAHRRKLRVGSHRRNAFSIVLRHIPNDEFVHQQLTDRLTQIHQHGVPNYFGSQRFGHDGANLRKAEQLFGEQRKLPRQQHRFAVSAARSWLFNAVLSARVSNANWNTFVPGDVVMLAGSRSWFTYDKLGDDAEQRLAEHDIHPSGPMWGGGGTASTDQAAKLEHQIVNTMPHWATGLADLGLKQERRALRSTVHDMTVQFDAESLRVGFTLNTGCFATAVLRELVAAPELALPLTQVTAPILT